jgi:hypothetical protein
MHSYLRPILGAAIGGGVALGEAYLNTNLFEKLNDRAEGWNRWGAAMWKTDISVTAQEGVRSWVGVGAALGAGYELARGLPLPAAVRGAACGVAFWLALEAAIRSAPGYGTGSWNHKKSARIGMGLASHGAISAWLTDLIA